MTIWTWIWTWKWTQIHEHGDMDMEMVTRTYGHGHDDMNMDMRKFVSVLYEEDRIEHIFHSRESRKFGIQSNFSFRTSAEFNANSDGRSKVKKFRRNSVGTLLAEKLGIFR
jgi:hypothetical protein